MPDKTDNFWQQAFQPTNIYYDNIDISEFSGIFDIEDKNNVWQQYNSYFPYDLSKEHLDLF